MGQSEVICVTILRQNLRYKLRVVYSAYGAKLNVKNFVTYVTFAHRVEESNENDIGSKSVP